MTTAAIPLSDRLTLAFDMARRVHGTAEDQAIAALLHDVVVAGGDNSGHD